MGGLNVHSDYFFYSGAIKKPLLRLSEQFSVRAQFNQYDKILVIISLVNQEQIAIKM
jgi:hypothetical protein